MLRDARRKLYGGEGRILLWSATQDAAREEFEKRGGRPPIPVASARLVNGEAVFDRIGLGMRFTAQARLETRGGAVQVAVKGPTKRAT